MTEEEWLATPGPWHLLEHVQSTAPPRKLRLFGCACVSRIWHLLDEVGRGAAVVAERYAEGKATRGDLRRAYVDAEAAANRCTRNEIVRLHCLQAAMWVSHERADTAGWYASTEAAKAYRDSVRLASDNVVDAVTPERGVQAAIFRDIFANPFRPVVVDPAWLTSTVVALAAGVYGERAFDRLPILADALQDAGCDNDHLLSHLRDPNATHVRGCWALDLVLGKS